VALASPASAAPLPYYSSCVSSVGSYSYHSINIPNVYLRSGSSGVCVKLLQNQLMAFGSFTGNRNTFVDGQFGSGTRTQVINFQRFMGISQDGVAGPSVWSLVLNNN
jgi:peptidoglycan hydrolase-like protein with peptidoglycan-binding domain